jgi:hypothetical protein
MSELRVCDLRSALANQTIHSQLFTRIPKYEELSATVRILIAVVLNSFMTAR